MSVCDVPICFRFIFRSLPNDIIDIVDKEKLPRASKLYPLKEWHSSNPEIKVTTLGIASCFVTATYSI